MFNLSQKQQSPDNRLDYQGFVVVLLGFEPRQADPETAVLPLHHKTVEIFIIDQNHSFGNFQGKNG